MSLAMKARQKVRRKATPKDRVFGCDLVEHLQLSGQDVPQVLKSCTEFVEKHGIVDGIYRLSGVSSNIQKLRLEFDTDRCPDLNKDVYLQDIHCVSSLCKAYFRELPNPLLTYQLYDKFADAVGIQLEEGRLVKIKEVLKELPPQHYRTLEFLMRHLVRIASFSKETNMHVRNLAIVWAPNLLRSKDIEASGFNGTAAFMEVRIQSIVVEFILTHVEQLFGDAPLCAGSRESLRKSLLLMGSPTVLFDDKYSLPCNVPTMLNQGDGPPQMRPYHTIIDLNEHKRKGSLKAKKWRSFFNLGRSSNDSKHKLNKPEGKEVDKMRLRPAKSMDSLSSMPCVSDDVPQLGRKRSQKQLVQGRESFNSHSSQDNTFLELEKIKAEEGTGESEGEATAKSEPTTPKASRSSLVGVAPQGRSPQSARSRAEKCVGVHISGPISSTVPFHITSNLTLTRLTRGLECPALSYRILEKEAPNSLPIELMPSLKQKEDKPKQMSESSMDEKDPTEPDTIVESSLDMENQLSLEVQDSFSFLDSQDAWLGDSLDSDQPWKSPQAAPDFSVREMDACPAMDDDMGSGFMNEMMRESWQLESFSAAPSLNYLSIEECMNEHSDEEDDQYYLATGCLDKEEHCKEVDPEEVYLSAYDDLSPLASELKHSQHLNEAPDAPRIGNLTEDQPFSLIGAISPGEPAESEADVELVPGSFLENDPQLADSHLGLELTSLAEEVDGVSLSSSDSLELETSEKNGTQAIKVKPHFPLSLQVEDANAGDEDDLFETRCLLQAEHPLNVSEENRENALAPDFICEETQPSLKDEQKLRARIASETEQVQWPPCLPSLDLHGPTLEVAGISDEHVDCEFLLQEAQQLLSREISELNRKISQASSPLEDQSLTGTDIQLSPSADNTFEMPCSETRPLSAPVLNLSPEQLALSHTSLPYAPLSDDCTESSSSLLVASFRKSCPESLLQKPYYAPPEETSAAPKHSVRPDGSVSMKKTSSVVQVQQVKSFPVVPPKPQFAKTPPFLMPTSPTKETSISWPDPPISDKTDGNEIKNGSDEDAMCKPPSPTGHSSESVEPFPAPSEMPTSPGNRPSGSGTLQKQRNSMPVCLEKYERDDVSRGDVLQILQCPSPGSLDKGSHWSENNELSGDDLQKMKCSLPENLDECSGNSKREDRKGEPPQKYLLNKQGEGSGATPQKQRWANWRNGGSMSFDEAVALAKERHGAQAPVRRMQTYCYGDAEGPHSLARVEKPPPIPKPALKPLGQRPLRPLSCIGTGAPSEALLSGKSLLAQASSDTTSEGQLSPNREVTLVARDLLPRSRLSLPKIGRRLSMSEEVPGAAR